jgi:hypothetical protein
MSFALHNGLNQAGRCPKRNIGIFALAINNQWCKSTASRRSSKDPGATAQSLARRGDEFSRVAHFRNRDAALPRVVNAGPICAYTKTTNRDQSILISSRAIAFQVNSPLRSVAATGAFVWPSQIA